MGYTPSGESGMKSNLLRYSFFFVFLVTLDHEINRNLNVIFARVDNGCVMFLFFITAVNFNYHEYDNYLFFG